MLGIIEIYVNAITSITMMNEIGWERGPPTNHENQYLLPLW